MMSDFMNTQQSALQTGIASLLDDKLLLDTLISVGYQTFECHKLVLSAMSPFFKAMFCGEFKEKHQREISIQNIDPETFGHVVQFLYGNVDIFKENNAENLLKAANILQIECLQISCEKYMLDRISPEKCFGYWRLACMLSRLNMASIAKKYILENFDVACQCEEFYHLSEDELVDLIKDDGLETAFEENICDASIRWILHDQVNRIQHMPKIFEQVRLPLTSREYLVEFIAKHMHLFIQESCFEFLTQATKYQSLSGRRHEISSIRTQQRDFYPYANVVVAIGSKGSVAARKLPSINQTDQTYAWKNIASLPFEPGLYFAACSYMNDIYVSGGLSSNKSHFAKFNGDEWQMCACLPTVRHRHNMVASGEALFLIGGSSDQQEFLSSIDKYVVSNESFEIEYGHLQTAVRSMSSFALKEKFYIFGGKSDTAYQTEKIQCFDLRTKQCSVINNLPHPVTFSNPVCLDDMLYILLPNYTIVKLDVEDHSVNVLDNIRSCEFSDFAIFLHLDNIYVFEKYKTPIRSSKVHIYNLATKEEIDNDLTSPEFRDTCIAVVKCLIPKSYV